MLAQLLKPEVQQFIKDHQADDPFSLSLTAKVSTNFPLKEAVAQIQALQKGKKKLPSWVKKEGIIWPPPVSVEQCSSEITAAFKAQLTQGKSMVDLTGGMGVDTFFFSNIFEEVTYVESNPDLVEVAKHNFAALGKSNIQLHNKTAEAFLANNQRKSDVIFLDPSRRVKDKKVFRIEDCTPNLYEIVPTCLQWTDQLLIKLSPLVDLSLLIKDFSPEKIWVVAVKNEVKEVLCLLRKEKTTTQIMAVELDDDGAYKVFDFFKEEEANAESDFSLPLKYIYEPSAAILKAGALKLVGRRFGLHKLHVSSHLFTSDAYIQDFSGKIFLLQEQIQMNKKDIARIVPGKKINVLTRNYPLSPEQLKKKMKLNDGGEQYLIGTTLMNGKKALLLCERIIN